MEKWNPHTLPTSAYWQQRSDEAMARADQMHDRDAKATMINVAAMYAAMARSAAEREAKSN